MSEVPLQDPVSMTLHTSRRLPPPGHAKSVLQYFERVHLMHFLVSKAPLQLDSLLQGCLTHKKQPPPPLDHHRSLGIQGYLAHKKPRSPRTLP